jgi:hypothetical protein
MDNSKCIAHNPASPYRRIGAAPAQGQADLHQRRKLDPTRGKGNLSMTATKRGPIQRASFALAALSSLILISSGARANDVSSRVSAQPAPYVGKFEPIERAPSGFGSLQALNSDIRRMKADSNEARLETTQ